MRTSIEHLFLFFVTLSVCGWIMEVIVQLVNRHKLINRGFLIGPYCPIYGTGSVLVIRLLSRFADRPWLVFLLSLIVCGLLEYMTSYVMEKLFHARWWDYSKSRLNIAGRVCAGTLIPFGVLSLFMLYVLKPFLFAQYAKLPQSALDGLCIALFVIMLTDAVISVTILAAIKKSAASSGGDDTETLTRAVRAKLSEQHALIRRMLLAFPTAKLYNGRILALMREKRKQIKAEAKAAKRALAQKIQETRDRD